MSEIYLVPVKDRVEIKGYEGLYEVDKNGDVYSILDEGSRRPGKLKPYDHNGYERVNLYDYKGVVKKHYVHRLVALHFIKKEYDGLVVNHIDGNKSNNHIYNLEWCTQKENITHSFSMELQPRAIPTYVDGVRFKSMVDASESLGLHKTRIRHERQQRNSNTFTLLGRKVICGDQFVQD